MIDRCTSTGARIAKHYNSSGSGPSFRLIVAEMKLTNKGKFFIQCPVSFDLLKKNKLAQRAMKAAEEGGAAQGRPLNWKVRRGGSKTARDQGSVSGTKDRLTFIYF